MDQTSSSDVPQELVERQEQKKIQEEACHMTGPNKSEMFMAAIGYVSFLCILPLVLMKESEFCRYHGKQALVLAIFLYFLDAVQIFPAKYSFLYVVLKLGIIIYAILKSLRGQIFRIPLVSDLAERFHIEFKS